MVAGINFLNDQALRAEAVAIIDDAISGVAQRRFLTFSKKPYVPCFTSMLKFV